ncbi:SRPBCC domain-containing protein [Rhizobium sp. RCAM05350]|nr:SRPBCC domain-containing protein [Rhizobium sp. RCAM05350]
MGNGLSGFRLSRRPYRRPDIRPVGAEPYVNTVHYHAIRADQDIVYSSTVSHENGLLFAGTVLLELVQTASGTDFRLTATGFYFDGDSPEGHKEGWAAMLNGLTAYLTLRQPCCLKPAHSQGKEFEMKYYYSPDTCALAGHIALLEAGFEPELFKVDIMTRTIDRQGDYLAVNPKGYVPLLEIGKGVQLTENVAVLDWIAENTPGQAARNAMERHRRIEMLAFLSSEVQKPFAYSFFLPGDEAVAMLRGMIEERFVLIAERITDGSLLGHRVGVEDALLYVMLRWARMVGMPVPEKLIAYRDAIEERPAVRGALREEGLI